MCGIVGILSKKPRQDVLEHMLSSLTHRGPDDAGMWHDNTVFLGQRRLSIQDLSPAGHQPMVSNDQNLVITYNGETYSHDVLIPLLDQMGVVRRGHSDTEMMLESIARIGLEQTLHHLIGMFAFALYDKSSQKLYLVRDRLGIKPLYYMETDSDFVFASEIKALQKHPGFNRQINPKALQDYMACGYVLQNSLYEQVKQVPPGCILEVDAQHHHQTLRPFWTLDQTIAKARKNPYSNKNEAYEDFENLLKDAVKRRMIGDVPLGAFLSGGIDSSVVVSLMQHQHSRPIQTFSMGFDQNDFNEAHHAKGIAQHLGCQHHEMYVSPKEAMDVIPLLPGLFDQPFADISAIPTYLLAKMTRGHVTVALSGDGGDELMAGYTRHTLGNILHRLTSYLPSILSSLPWRQLHKTRGTQIAALLKSKSFLDFYHALTSPTSDHTFEFPIAAQYAGNFGEFSQIMDTLFYLPDDVLQKVDRTTMAAHLEARVPLLDHRLLACAWRMPWEWKVRGRTGKLPLRHVLQKYVPPHLFERPKMGFSVPMHTWLRGDLKSWAHDLLHGMDEDMLGIKPADLFTAHQNGVDHTQILWRLLMYEGWQKA